MSDYDPDFIESELREMFDGALTVEEIIPDLEKAAEEARQKGCKDCDLLLGHDIMLAERERLLAENEQLREDVRTLQIKLKYLYI